MFYGQLTWTPDGKDVIYGTSSYAMLSDWGLLRQAPTQTKTAVTTLGQTTGYFAQSALSPDAQFLATDYYGSNGRGPSDGLSIFQLGKPSTGNFYNDPIKYTATSVFKISEGHSPAWSPDGKTLAYVVGDSIWLWDRAGQKSSKFLEGALAGGGLTWLR
jgi:hypothetical protein